MSADLNVSPKQPGILEKDVVTKRQNFLSKYRGIASSAQVSTMGLRPLLVSKNQWTLVTPRVSDTRRPQGGAWKTEV